MTRLTHGRIPGLRGMGATGYTDTGAGITPANFQSTCCTSNFFAGGFGASVFDDSSMPCNAWLLANGSLIGNYDPCSNAAAQALGIPLPPMPSTLPAPSIITTPGPDYGQAAIPGTNQPIATTADANALIAQLIAAQTAAQKAQIQAFMNSQAATQCGAQAAVCAGNSIYRKVSADCTSCDLDFTSSTFWFGIAGVGLLVFLVAKLA